MVIGSGLVLVLTDIITSFLPFTQVVIVFVVIGIVFGVAVTGRIEGALGGLVMSAVYGDLADWAKTSLPADFFLTHIFLWIGLLVTVVGLKA